MELELPVIYLLPTRLSSDELHEWESRVPNMTRDASEASFIIGKSRYASQACSSPNSRGVDVGALLCWWNMSRHGLEGR